MNNNKFGESEEYDVIGMIEESLFNNTTLVYVNLDGNGLYNDTASRFIKVMKEGNNPKLLIEFGIMANKDNMA